MVAKIRHVLHTLAIVVIGLAALPVWAVTSIVFGRDTLVWFEDYLNRRRSK